MLVGGAVPQHLREQVEQADEELLRPSARERAATATAVATATTAATAATATATTTATAGCVALPLPLPLPLVGLRLWEPRQQREEQLHTAEALRRLAHRLRDARVAAHTQRGGRRDPLARRRRRGRRGEPVGADGDDGVVWELVAVARLGVEGEQERRHPRLIGGRVGQVVHPHEVWAERPDLLHRLRRQLLAVQVDGTELRVERVWPRRRRVERRHRAAAATAEGAAGAVSASRANGRRRRADEGGREALRVREAQQAILLRLAVDVQRRLRLGEEPRRHVRHADVVPAPRLEDEAELEDRAAAGSRGGGGRRAQAQARRVGRVVRRLLGAHALEQRLDAAPLLVEQREEPRRPPQVGRAATADATPRAAARAPHAASHAAAAGLVAAPAGDVRMEGLDAHPGMEGVARLREARDRRQQQAGAVAVEDEEGGGALLLEHRRERRLELAVQRGGARAQQQQLELGDRHRVRRERREHAQHFRLQRQSLGWQ